MKRRARRNQDLSQENFQIRRKIENMPRETSSKRHSIADRNNRTLIACESELYRPTIKPNHTLDPCHGWTPRFDPVETGAQTTVATTAGSVARERNVPRGHQGESFSWKRHSKKAQCMDVCTPDFSKTLSRSGRRWSAVQCSCRGAMDDES